MIMTRNELVFFGDVYRPLPKDGDVEIKDGRNDAKHGMPERNPERGELDIAVVGRRCCKKISPVLCWLDKRTKEGD